MSSGAAWLTGRPDGPFFGPPEGLPGLVDQLGTELGTDAWQLLVERAAARRWRRRGTVSCGGATRLVRAGDGWIAVSLARGDDHDLVAAWLECDVVPGDPWGLIAREVAGRDVRTLDDRAAVLGLPVGVVASVRGRIPRSAVDAGPFAGLPVTGVDFGPPRRERSRMPLVVDLSSLWAGPLCTRLLVDSGFRVVKVESTRRPDAVRTGDPVSFDLLHAGKRSVALDFDDPSGRDLLRRVVRAGDIVVEASRPRALRQLGIHAEALLADPDGPSLWISITARGRTGPGAQRVGFGDDIAAAGGLVVTDAGGPVFCGDAIADPLAGMTAAVAARRAWRHGGRWLLDVSMVEVAAAAAGPAQPLPPGATPPSPSPSPTPARGVAVPLGSDTRRVLTELVGA